VHSNHDEYRVSFSLIASWILLVSVGMAGLYDYETKPGAAAEPPDRWPSDSGLVRATARHTLVMVVHPRCSCSRASLSVLERLASDLKGRVTTHLVFVRPAGTPEGFERSDLWTRALALGARVTVDPSGIEARRFGAQTSGHVALFSPTGRRLFFGGLTSSRGHEGSSIGHDRILAAVLDGNENRQQAAVFGCPTGNGG
jgi:hypothetical protein